MKGAVEVGFKLNRQAKKKKRKMGMCLVMVIGQHPQTITEIPGLNG